MSCGVGVSSKFGVGGDKGSMSCWRVCAGGERRRVTNGGGLLTRSWDCMRLREI